MKNLSLLFCILSIFAVSISFTACSGGSGSDSKETGKEYTSAYICPMHCEGSGSDKEGKCPTCKMAYVANEDYKADNDHGHKHEHNNDAGHGSHEGHDHSGHDHDGHEH